MNKFFNTEKENQSKDELLSNKIDKLQKSLEIFSDRLFISYEKPLDEFKEYFKDIGIEPLYNGYQILWQVK